MGNKSTDAIECFIRSKMLCIERDYTWEIPSGCPIAWEKGTTRYERNLNLRKALNEEWHRSPDNRLPIALWYVKNWGGIRKIADEKVLGFVKIIEAGQLPPTLDCVSSWSKICAIADPEKYVIFDSRVSFALNAIQIIKKGKIEWPLPLLQSRNTNINPAIQRLRKMPGFARAINSRDVSHYIRYLDFMSRFGKDIQTAEMTLFANAEKLAALLSYPPSARHLPPLRGGR